MGKKRKFIDKRTATTFRVVHRGYQDPLWGTENRSDYVLEPVPNLNALKKGIRPPTIEDAEELLLPSAAEVQRINSPLPTEKEFLPVDAYGFPNDGYDYEKHLKPMGEGTFIPAEVQASGALFGMDPLMEDVQSKHIIGGQEKLLPPDVLELLEGNYEDDDLQDDFVTVAEEECDEECDDDMPPPLEKDFLDLETDDDFAYEPEQYKQGPKKRKLLYVAKLEKFDNVIDKQFDEMLEWSDDDIGELDENDPAVKGVMDLSDMKFILDEFLQDKHQTPFEKNAKIVPDDIAHVIRNIEAIDVTVEDDTLEDALAGYEYLSTLNAPQKEQWDCESILSTYSNLYNHPTMLDDRPRKIKLSKMGMPLDYVGRGADEEEEEEEEEEDDNMSTVSTNFGERRPKKESKEEKAARKKAVKEMRKNRRAEKKATKMEFKEEENRQTRVLIKTKNPTGFRL